MQLRLLRVAVTTSRGPHAALSSVHRLQSTDQFHRYIHDPKIVQPDGLDGLPQTKAAQQYWLNTEQWVGYSDTYLKRWMQYPATQEHPNPQLTPRNALLYQCLQLVYDLYGTLADDLQKLHDDPLHPGFHLRIARLRKDRERIAAAIDACYADLHPTVKTVYDAFLVRRYYHLGDWIEYVVRKRERIIVELSPEYVQQVVTARKLSDAFIRRLRLMERAFYTTPELGLMSNDELEQYTAAELATLRQKALYFRKMRRLGVNQTVSDFNPH